MPYAAMLATPPLQAGDSIYAETQEGKEEV
jgi:hypothetical protein